MKIALDTNRYSDLMRGDAAAVTQINSADEIHLPLPVLAKMRMGFLGGSRSRENEAILARFLRRPRVKLLLPDEQTTLHYAAIYHQLRRQGTPIPTHDIWIAALVLQKGLILYARDAHFDHLPQIPRI